MNTFQEKSLQTKKCGRTITIVWSFLFRKFCHSAPFRSFIAHSYLSFIRKCNHIFFIIMYFILHIKREIVIICRMEPIGDVETKYKYFIINWSFYPHFQSPFTQRILLYISPPSFMRFALLGWRRWCLRVTVPVSKALHRCCFSICTTGVKWSLH